MLSIFLNPNKYYRFEEPDRSSTLLSSSFLITSKYYFKNTVLVYWISGKETTIE